LGVKRTSGKRRNSSTHYRIAVGKAPAATSTSTYIPVGWVEVIQIAVGDQLSALGNDSTGGSLNVTECLT
jgi:hypothetical protein